jgi:hypothetical protein
MKRTLVTATAVALLLAGCATGDTGHVTPDISPDLEGPLPTQAAAGSSGGSSGGSDGGSAQESPAPGTSAAPASELEAAFAAEVSDEDWYDDVTGLDTDDDTVLVTTDLTAGDEAAVDVCEAAFAAAESTGITEPRVLVRDVDGETISERDPAAGDEGCSS